MYMADPFEIPETLTKEGVFSLVAFLTGLTPEQVKRWHPRVVEIDEVAHIFEAASTSVEINKLLHDEIFKLLGKWRHSKHKKIILEVFSKPGTGWRCDCMECNKGGPIYD